jgi:hypothetical protein
MERDQGMLQAPLAFMIDRNLLSKNILRKNGQPISTQAWKEGIGHPHKRAYTCVEYKISHNVEQANTVTDRKKYIVNLRPAAPSSKGINSILKLPHHWYVSRY